MFFRQIFSDTHSSEKVQEHNQLPKLELSFSGFLYPVKEVQLKTRKKDENPELHVRVKAWGSRIVYRDIYFHLAIYS